MEKSYQVTGVEQATLLSKVNFPDKVQLETIGKTEQDYMGPNFCKYWEKYVLDGCKAYFKN